MDRTFMTALIYNKRDGNSSGQLVNDVCTYYMNAESKDREKLRALIYKKMSILALFLYFF